MKKLLIGFILLGAAISMSSCSGGKNCRGGGWYGDRNLTVAPITIEKEDNTTLRKDKTKRIVTDDLSVTP